MGESVNPPQLAIQLAVSLKGIEALAKLQKGGDRGAINGALLASRQGIQGRARQIVTAAELRPHAHFFISFPEG